jgi:hypothetical protein
VLCLWSNEFMAFLWFVICGLVQVLFMILVVNFLFFNSHFPHMTLGLDLFPGAYFNKVTVALVPCT